MIKERAAFRSAINWRVCIYCLSICFGITAGRVRDCRAQEADENVDQRVYLFTSFRGNGEQGLRFACSRDGYQWKDVPGHFLKPNVGQRKLMRDPSIAQGDDGVFHLVWTTGWDTDQGFGHAHSQDLVHWSEQQFVPAMQHEPTTVNVWAPELYYDQRRQRFIICWASTIPGRFPDHLEPHDNNQRMYYTITRDFEEFEPTKLFFDPGFSVIDCCIVPKDDRYVLVLKDNTRPLRLLKVAFGDSPLGPWKDVSGPFTERFTEGPTVLKMGEQWLIYYDAYEKKTYGAAKTKDFLTFDDISDRVSFPDGHKHGTVIEVTRTIFDGLVAAGIQQTAEQRQLDPEYVRVVTERAEKIVAKLELEDKALATRIRDILAEQYQTLSGIHDTRDAAIDLIDGNSPIAAKVRDDADLKLADAHKRFVARLRAWLNPAQVEQVKDGMTYGVLPATYARYCEMLPQLTEVERAEIRALLLEAREHAMDAGSSEKKHAWFRKYKGKINNYLSAAGYDLKQAERDLAEAP